MIAAAYPGGLAWRASQWAIEGARQKQELWVTIYQLAHERAAHNS